MNAEAVMSVGEIIGSYLFLPPTQGGLFGEVEGVSGNNQLLIKNVALRLALQATLPLHRVSTESENQPLHSFRD